MKRQDQLKTWKSLEDRHGLDLMPVKGKVATQKDWQKKDRTRFKARDYSKNYNAAIRHGQNGSGTICIDVDERKKFEKYIKQNKLTVSETLTVQSSKGKYHLIYLLPESQNGTRFANKSFKEHGFDIKADQGYTVAPGSIHPETGEVYRIINDKTIAPCPRWAINRSKEEVKELKEADQEGLITEWNENYDLTDCFPISDRTEDLVKKGEKKGKRSEAIWSVLLSLVQTGFADSLIFKIFDKYPIGEKYREKRGNKTAWLQKQINKARAYIADHQDEGACDDHEVTETDPEQIGENTNPLSAVILTAAKIRNLPIDSRKCFLDPWLKEYSSNLVSGWRNVGKTWFAQGILNAVSKGEGFGPWKCEQAANCLYLDGEMTIYDNQERIKILNMDSKRDHNLYFYVDAYANQLGVPKADLTNPKWWEHIKNILLEYNIRLWVIDNIASLAAGLDENSKKDWDPINQQLLDLRFSGISTILLHHVGKLGDQRGTSGREDNLDTSINLGKPKNYHPEDGARFTVKFTKSRVDTRHLPLIKTIEMQLMLDENDQYIFTHSNPKDAVMKEILTLFNEGEKNKDIAKELGITASYVSKVNKLAVNQGYLDNDKKLTKEGNDYLNEGCEF